MTALPASPVTSPDIEITRWQPVDGDGVLDGLAEVLRATVSEGGSVGFVLPFGHAEARAFWSGLEPSVRCGARVLWLARWQGRIVGTVSLVLDAPPNGRHRAEVSKLQVHPDARRLGVARALMHTLEAHASALGRRLLVLDTRSGDHAERLYRSMGYEVCGQVPDYARATDSDRLDATTILFKRLDATVPA